MIGQVSVGVLGLVSSVMGLASHHEGELVGVRVALIVAGVALIVWAIIDYRRRMRLDR